MRVHDSNLNAVTIGARQTGRTDTVQTGRAGGYGEADTKRDRVSLSDMSSALARVADDTPEQIQKVAQLAAAYRAGNYRPGADQVARGIVNDAIRVT
jgi:anti-sigma28 factor (negative regulator of flagellin synthesis)